MRTPFTPLTSILLTALLVLGLPAVGLAQGESTAVQTRVLAQSNTASPGGQVVIAVELNHADSYHTWPSEATKLPDDIASFAIRTELLLLTPPAWATLDGVQYPEPHPDLVANPNGGDPVKVPLFSGVAVSYLRIRLAPDAPLGEQTLSIGVNFQACDSKQCQFPEEQDHKVKLTLVAPGSAAATPNEPTLFASFDATKWSTAAPSPAQIKPTPGTAKPAPAPSASTPTTGAQIFGFNLGSNFLLVALAAALGGFILNLTPCVLPVIPIKVLTLTQHATSRKHALVLGLWMAFGVVAFWTVIGIPMAVISRQLDPSQFIFGVWWVCLGIGIIIAVMGLGIMGLFTFNLPQSVYMVEAKADSPFGSFLFGVLTAVLGLPCFGFVAGGLLAAAATMPAYLILTVFVGMGVGMAAPYLVLSVYPQLLKFIPRTGPASELVKQVMGVLLLAAAAFFVAAGIQVLLSDYPYLSGSMQWWATGFFVAIAGIWLTMRTFLITKRIVPRIVFALVSIAMTLGIGLFANDRFASDRESHLAAEAAMSAAGSKGEVPSGVWLHYTPELLATVRQSGRPVFLDFTASWCINCKGLKAAILDPEPLHSTFKERGVVVLEVDCSSRNGQGAKLLKDLGRTGVPQWAVYGPGKADPSFVTISTPSVQAVLDAMNHAGVPAAANPASAQAAKPPANP